MKSLFLITIIILSASFFAGCERNEQNVPDAFEEKSVTDDIVSYKRSNPDLISELYNEILEKNKDLKALEDSLESLKDKTSDKTEDLNRFFENNQNYYTAAYQRIEIIQDSVLREKIFKKLSENENSFNSKTEKITKLLAEISQKQAELNDYHTSLKILLTMKQNSDFQKNNMPDTSTISKLKAAYQNLIKTIKEKIEQ